ncbi:hypothetical protein [Rhodococcus sp. IEGM 1379]|uniref:hypothetical protein n=1 Tax=Rhodococcus sp. IEGM 1379 TaxID=3047086 RepID=UPI0024B78CEB|nr:hypothetical protein [Rhodococcus sp. IEGM 1379]MDI9917001.1 hypothetical protein [Rhodococcus sp. IEGM 1379]
MRTVNKMVVGALSLGIALSAGIGSASASGTNQLDAASPRNNTVTFTFTNTARDVTSCTAYGNGVVYFQTDNVRIAPESTVKVTMADVPAGNYSIGWSCRSFAQEKHYVTVAGTATPSANPHVVPNDALPTANLSASMPSFITMFGS